MPNNPVLFTIKESRSLTREQWHQFTGAVRANGHSTAAVFRAFILSYTRTGLGPAAEDYHDPEPQGPRS